MSQILIIVHQQTSDPGRVGEILQARGYTLDIRCPSVGDRLPTTLDHHEATVICGGPMSANDSETLPFIQTELDWLSIALTSGKPCLGICLGAQLIARVLGATVSPHPDGVREIGYFPILPTSQGTAQFQGSLQVYHWHGEGFELPKGAVLLARGETFVNQAFRYGETVYGLQFHPEMTREILERWTTSGADQLVLPGAQSRDQQIQKHARYGSAFASWLENFLTLWLEKKQGAQQCRAPMKQLQD